MRHFLFKTWCFLVGALITFLVSLYSPLWSDFFNPPVGEIVIKLFFVILGGLYISGCVGLVILFLATIIRYLWLGEYDELTLFINDIYGNDIPIEP